MNDHLNINKKSNIDWVTVSNKQTEKEVVLEGTFKSGDTTYKITVKFARTEEHNPEKISDVIKTRLNQIEDTALAQLSGHTLQTNLKELKEHKTFHVYQGDTSLDSYDKKLSEIIERIENVFSYAFGLKSAEEIEKQEPISILFEEVKPQENFEKKPEIFEEPLKKPIPPQPTVKQIKKAQDIYHGRFLKTGFKKQLSKQPPNINKEGRVTCTIVQFKKAQDLLHKRFPEIEKSDSEEKSIIASQLLQIILTGQYTSLETDCCFELKELKNHATNEESISSGQNSCILDEWMQHLRKKNNETSEQHFSRSLVELAGFLKKDNIERPVRNHPVINGKECKSHAEYRELLKKEYTNYLIQNKKNIPAIIKSCQQSDLYKKLRYHPPFKEFFKGQEPWFSSKLLEKILEPEIKNNTNVQKIIDELKQVIEDTKMDSKIVKELAKSTNLKEIDIEPLLRFKAFELMIPMTQGFNAGLIENIPAPLNGVEKLIEVDATDSNTITTEDRTYPFLLKFSDDFSEVTLSHQYIIRKTGAEGSRTFAEASCFKSFPLGNRKIFKRQLIANPTFSWRKDPALIERLQKLCTATTK